MQIQSINNYSQQNSPNFNALKNIRCKLGPCSGHEKLIVNELKLLAKENNFFKNNDVNAIISVESWKGAELKLESKPAATTQTGSPAKNATANPTTSPIYINGVKTDFEAYNINGNNYFKLRDVALALSGTDAQFNVTWDNDKQVINLISKQAYGKNGALAAGNGKVKAATLNSAPIMKDGAYVNMTAYNIEGNNFFKLRDLGTQFGFEVGWDAAANAVTVNTGK